MRVTGIDHIVLNTADAERAVAWWRDGLGLEPVRLEEFRRGEVIFVSMRVSDSTIIDLFPLDRTGENVNHVALVVEGVDIDELAASGRFEIESGPSDLFGARGMGRGVYFRDPDGNLIELRSYPPA